MFSRAFWKLYWKLAGWKVKTAWQVPKDAWPGTLRQAIIAVAPHTSGWDVVTGMAARAVMPIPNAHYLAKKELFDGPFGWFFKASGGVPVDRGASTNLVDQVVEHFKTNSDFVLALSPEGTRKRVDRLKTGFWHIAKLAQVPIVLAGLDFKHKLLHFSEPFVPGDTPEHDWPKIIRFFAAMEGKHPENGLAHLQNQAQ
ncbi:1-acyl-sn-glycerol-3-phosphate acyltransferase [Flavihumibacter petaseus]|uniref:Putative acyltransferase n=1 Tax=Flavihumibacter petaseus NBRC 106054 TaxID=1220578 RepID=A0A0E9MZ54_9BACT|nr:1-acyl-sn-glycerol-3-phosphate acyltransferase [Flavihumibacter petaseus]GAO42828.1 putative acyltransferase [Flavihumibacter petaseus NBRC 106054]